MKKITLTGRIVEGEGMATGLGCPTANLAIEQGVVIPGLGVYVGEAELDGKRFPSLICVNDGRTGHNLKMEVHLIGQNMNLNGRQMDVSLLEKMRGLVPYDEEIMKPLIQEDLIRAREWFEKRGYSIPA